MQTITTGRSGSREKPRHHRLQAALLIGMLLAVVLSACQTALGAPVVQPASRVLFIGNSFTFYNDGVDQQLSRLDPTVHAERIAAGGYSLMDHWRSGLASQAIKSQHWDFVVLQEQSQAPVIEKAQVVAYAAKLSEQARAAGSKPVLFMTWQRPDSLQAGVTTRNLSDAYYRVGRQVGAIVAPAGVAFANALYERPRLSLNVEDGHPTLAGTYLATCVIYATLFGKSPVGLAYAPAGISANDKAFLQRIAAESAGY